MSSTPIKEDISTTESSNSNVNNEVENSTLSSDNIEAVPAAVPQIFMPSTPIAINSAMMPSQHYPAYNAMGSYMTSGYTGLGNPNNPFVIIHGTPPQPSNFGLPNSQASFPTAFNHGHNPLTIFPYYTSPYSHYFTPPHQQSSQISAGMMMMQAPIVTPSTENAILRDTTCDGVGSQKTGDWAEMAIKCAKQRQNTNEEKDLSKTLGNMEIVVSNSSNNQFRGSHRILNKNDLTSTSASSLHQIRPLQQQQQTSNVLLPSYASPAQKKFSGLPCEDVINRECREFGQQLRDRLIQGGINSLFNVDSYTNSRFFVIKSIGEDDVYRSIKYGIWCSTSNGNKKLSAAFKSVQARHGQIFLFFSVNGSGHFCGVCEMLSDVDTASSRINVWTQNQFTGEIRVKWLIIKDIPNTALRHIRLPSNENKPITNSRDCTEVDSVELGLQAFTIMCNYSAHNSLMTDFSYYEAKQKNGMIINLSNE